MDDHVSSTTFNTDEEHDKLQSEFGTEKMSTLDGMEVHENNEAEAKHIGEEDDILDLTGGVQDAVKSEEDPPKETFPSGPEPQQATEPEAPQPSDSAAADLTEEQTKAEVTEDKIPEPETEEPTVKPTVKEDTVVQPDTEETVLKPETEDIFAKPEPPIEAPVIAEKEAPSPASAVSLVELLYWRDIKTTGVVFGAGLFLLLSLTVCSIVSVCSYIALALLSVTITFRIYKGILQAVQKSDEGHPFKLYLDQDVSLSEDVVHKYSDLALERLNTLIKELRRLFLVEDLVDSLKFAVGMWVLTYVGALFNGLTLLILGLIATFSCPVIYEKNQAQIDHYIALVSTQVKDIVGKVQAKVPGMKRKTE